MTAPELVDRIISDPSQAAKLLAKSDAKSGTSRAFFDYVFHLYGEDHAKLASLRPASKVIVRHGDDPALGYRSLGIVERTNGRWAASAQAFLKAGELASTSRDRLTFQIGAIDGLARAGHVEEALILGHKLATELHESGAHGIAARAQLNLGYALMEQDRYAEAISELADLPEQLRSAGFDLEATSSRLALSTSLLFGGEASDARKEAERAVNEAEGQGNLLLARIARGNIAYADILAGDIDKAVTALLVLRKEHEEEPVEIARVLEYLGDAYLAMNMFSEATDAFHEAEDLSVNVSALHKVHLRYGAGLALLAADRLPEASSQFRFAYQQFRKLGNSPWAVAAEADLALSEIRLGSPSGNRRLRRSVLASRNSANAYQRCRILLLSAENGGPSVDLVEAGRLIKQHSFFRWAWRFYAEQARRSSGRSRLSHFRNMFRAILADQARTSSVAAKLRFLYDKQKALRDYLDELLLTPSPSKLQEAIEVITQSRAVALLDEVLLSRRSGQSESVLQALTDLREQINTGETPTHHSSSRRAALASINLDHLQRLWIEETYDVPPTELTPSVAINAANESMLYVSGPGSLRVLNPSGVVDLGLTEPDLDSRLEWLSYELLAPMADPKADPAPALSALRDIAKELLLPILVSSPLVGVCPEGGLWRVPWIACLDSLEIEKDLEIRLHPAFQGRHLEINSAQAMVWIADHSDLPRADDELRAFQDQYPDAVVCRSASEVREALSHSQVSILHVISHARFRAGHPMFSSLDFTDGPVLATEIARSGFSAQIVTLSGCDTARVSDIHRFEPDGLVRAFLACGAGYVVGSAWPLDDEAAMRFYSTFFKSLRSSANIHQSLRIARTTVRLWKGHPYFWAFPLLYAGYRS